MFIIFWWVMFIIFWGFLMFWQIFLSPQMKRSVTVIIIIIIIVIGNFANTSKNLLKNRNWTFPLVLYFIWKLEFGLNILSTIVGRLTSRVLELSYTFFNDFLIFSVCTNFFFLFQGKYLYMQKFNEFYEYLMNFINCQK